jgi:hypothetical protein
MEEKAEVGEEGASGEKPDKNKVSQKEHPRSIRAVKNLLESQGVGKAIGAMFIDSVVNATEFLVNDLLPLERGGPVQRPW